MCAKHRSTGSVYEDQPAAKPTGIAAAATPLILAFALAYSKFTPRNTLGRVSPQLCVRRRQDGSHGGKVWGSGCTKNGEQDDT